MDLVIIHPEPPSELKALAKELLALADSPLQVEYVMWPEPGFRVPEELFGKFAAARKNLRAAPEPVAENPVEGGPEAVKPEPIKRKPGRPKKIQEGQ